jgi:hypothetical protein
MSEKIYVLLLGPYSSQFREAYGDEAIQLFRDRLRDERGFLSRVRLRWDMLADLVASLPREHAYLRPSLAGVSSRQRLEGVCLVSMCSKVVRLAPGHCRQPPTPKPIGKQ